MAELAAYAAIAGSVATVINMMNQPDAPAPQATPAVAPPTAMPTPDDDAAKAMKKKQAMALSKQRGRQSTILSDPMSSDLLGG